MIPYYTVPGLKFRDKIVKKINSGRTIAETMDHITDVVCEVLGVYKPNIFTKCRRQEYVFARQISIYLLRKNHPMVSFKTIGNYFDGRDHTTCIHSIARIQDLIDTEEKTREIVKLIEERM